MTEHAGICIRRSQKSECKPHTDKHEPSDTQWTDKPSVSETLDPQAKCKAAPCANKVLGCFPEEYGKTTSGDPSNEG